MCTLRQELRICLRPQASRRSKHLFVFFVLFFFSGHTQLIQFMFRQRSIINLADVLTFFFFLNIYRRCMVEDVLNSFATVAPSEANKKSNWNNTFVMCINEINANCAERHSSAAPIWLRTSAITIRNNKQLPSFLIVHIVHAIESVVDDGHASLVAISFVEPHNVSYALAHLIADVYPVFVGADFHHALPGE